MAKTGGSRLKMGPLAATAILYALGFLGTVLIGALALNKIIGMEWIGYLMPLVVLYTLVVSVPYWRKLDEPSREAHKFAFTWGAGCALVIVIMAGLEVMFVPGLRHVVQDWIESWVAFSRRAFGDTPGAAGFYLGILASTFVLLLGYAAVWIGWWARQRIGTTSG